MSQPLTPTLDAAVLGTAGHIDHGKSSLVKALTGLDMDRLPEEKARGITIELGFAYLDLPNQQRVGIVDVPGHERFIRTMLAGAWGIDVVMLVVAADDSVMPQTREHFQVCQLLGIRQGLIAITKCDLADAEMVALVEEEVRDLVRGSFLEQAPIVRCSAMTGEGIDTLRATIAEVVSKRQHTQRGPFLRLPVDRVFSKPGFGSVVTGTLADGQAVLNDPVVVLPSHATARIRGIQVHHAAVERVSAGSRVALNLAGLKAEDVKRGDVIVAPDSFIASDTLDVALEVLAQAERPLKHRTQVVFYSGTAEVYGRALLVGVAQLTPGAKGFARLRLETPVVTRREDRFVLRLYGPNQTIGGGVVLDPAPTELPVRQDVDSRLLDLADWLSGDARRLAAVALRQSLGGMSELELQRRVSLTMDVLSPALEALHAEGVAHRLLRQTGVIWLHRDSVGELSRRMTALLARRHAEQPLSNLGLSPTALRQQIADTAKDIPRESFEFALTTARQAGLIEERHGTLALPAHQATLSTAQADARQRLEAAFKTAGFAPPNLDDALASLGLKNKPWIQDLVRAMCDETQLVDCGTGVIFAKEAFDKATDLLRDYLRANPGGATLANLRDLTGMSRKYAVPFMETLDALGITQRVGDTRTLATR